MKRFEILSLFLLFSLIFCSISVYAADYTCPINQQIFRISGQVNAHAETVSGSSGYVTDICYDDYFGTFAGTPDRSCAGNPVLISLSGNTNAHAEKPSIGNYPIDVCYEGLACTFQQANTVCTQGTVAIASFSSSTNAHVGIPGAYSGVGAYKICCAIGGIINPPEETNFTIVQWKNFKGVPITDSNVNKTVQLYVGTSFPANTKIDFEVWEQDPIFDDSIRTFSANTNANGNAKVDWLITDKDIHDGSDCNGNNCAEAGLLEFYFLAHSPASKEVNRSYILNVNGTAGKNTPPIARIDSPIHRGIYYKDTTVRFNHSSSDSEGPVKVSWTIDEDNYKSTKDDFNYTFKTAGQKTITLRVTDSQGLWNEAQVAVLVLSSPGILTFVNKPSHRQLVISSDDPLKVDFNGNDSYVVNSAPPLNNGCPTLTCLAGNCPGTTENVPQACGLNNINVQGGNKGFSEMSFNWTFDDGSYFFGSGIFSGTKQYASGNTGDHNITLTVNYSNVAMNIFFKQKTNRIFTLLGVAQCIDDGHTFIEIDDGGNEIRRWPTLAPGGVCGGPDWDINTLGDNCCPSGYSCTDNGCIPTNITQCSDYSNKTACNKDPLKVAQIDPLQEPPPLCGDVFNGSLTICSCFWNATVGTNDPEFDGLCKFRESYTTQGCTGADCEPPSCTPNKCEKSASDQSACVNGYVTVIVNATFISGGQNACPGGVTKEQCESEGGTRTIPCGRPLIALGFFGSWQFLCSLLIIGIIYSLIIFRKKSR